MYWLPIVFMCVANGQQMECGFVTKEMQMSEKVCEMTLKTMLEDLTPIPAVKAIEGTCVKAVLPTV